MKLRFAKATPEDIPAIFAQAKSLIDIYEDITSIDYDKVMDWMAKKIAKNISLYTAVTRDNIPCAYYHLCEDGELDDLYVLPGFQGQGIGSLILEKCISDTQKSLYLYVFSRNVRAINFYKRFGFEICETVGKTRVIMARKG